MRKWINQLGIKKKLIFYSYLIITPILLIISIFLFIRNYRNFQYLQTQTNMQSVQSLSDSMEVLQMDMIDLCTYISINNDITKILSSDDTDILNKKSKLWLQDAPMQIIQDMIALKGYIKTIALYPENGVRPYLRCIDASSYIIDLDTVRNAANYNEAIRKKGKILWLSAPKDQNDIYQANRTDKIVLHRIIYDQSKKNVLGYLVIGAEADKFTDFCKNIADRNDEGILVLSPEGNELIRYGVIDEKMIKYLTREDYLSKLYKENNSHFNFGEYIIFSSRNQTTGTYVFKILPKSDIKLQMYDIAFEPVALLMGFLAGLFPILIFVSNIVSKPLKKLCIAMENFKKGDFSQQVEVNTKDEVGIAAACFNLMVTDIKTLIDNNYGMALKEKESELIALQAQINPHFLYNTLDSLYWRAQEAGNEEIAEDILALSQLFRLVLGQGKGIITVEQERELISEYLHIQKMRFSKRFKYEIHMEEDILDACIPKLILQPFVENVIVHGLEKMGTPCELLISGKNKDGYIEFCIQDTGIGMSEEQIEAIWSLGESNQYARQRISGYAIKNVKERLELKYHEDFSLEIKSQLGKGTVVYLTVPMEKKEIR